MGISKILNHKIKGICSVISAVLINLLTGSVFAFPNLITYYQKFTNNKFEEKQLYFVAPTAIFILNSLPSLTGILDDKFGTRVLNIVGSLFLLCSQLIIYFSKDYALLIISYALIGLCGSLTYFQSLKNCWKYFPNKKGLISGIIFSSFGLSAFIFTSIADGVINPDENKPKTDAEIAEGFKLYLRIFIICIIIMGSLSGLLCFPYKKEKEFLESLSIVPNEDNNEEQNSDKDKNEEYENNDNEKKEDNHYSAELKDEEKEESENLTLKESILSIDFFLCLVIALCTLIYGFLLTNTYRKFGEIAFIKKENEKEKAYLIFEEINSHNSKMVKSLKSLSKVFTLLNTISRLIWGYISDKIRFKILYPIVCINQLICGSLIYLSSNNIVTYYIVVNLSVLSFSGHVILFPTLIHTKFGVENSVYLLGICGIFIGVSALVGPFITLLFLHNKTDYLIIYLIGVAPTIISLLISLFIKVEKKQKKEAKSVDDNYDDDEEDLTNEKETVNNGVELNLNKQ